MKDAHDSRHSRIPAGDQLSSRGRHRIGLNLSLPPSAKCLSPLFSQARRAERLWPTAKAVRRPVGRRSSPSADGRQNPFAPSDISVAHTGLAHAAYASSHRCRHGPQSAARRLTGSDGRGDLRLTPRASPPDTIFCPYRAASSKLATACSTSAKVLNARHALPCSWQ